MLLTDVTLRDGEQMPGLVFDRATKRLLATLSRDFGCGILEVMPIVSKQEREFVKELLDVWEPSRIRAMLPLREEFLEDASHIGVERVMLFTSLSKLHVEKKLGVSLKENLERSLQFIDKARDYGFIIDFGGEDASRADINYVLLFGKAIEKYIDFYIPADTLGFFDPFTAFEFFKTLKQELRCRIEFHGHNDYGLATANAYAAYKAGVDAIAGTFCGIGERAGNVPLEEIAMLLEREGVNFRFDLIGKIGAIIDKFIPLQPHKPWVGENVFTHESGIHVDGILKDPRTYENVPPEKVGKRRRLLFGKHSGRKGLEFVLKKYRISVEKDELDMFLDYIKRRAEEKGEVFEEEEIPHVFFEFLEDMA